MDRYTKMCSLCEPLQEACPIDFKGYTPLFKGVVYDRDYKFFYEKETKDAKRLWEKRIVKAYWLPTIEQLIEMLEEINILWEIRKEFATTNKNSIEYWYCAINCNNEYTGNIPKIALLKLAAYERWGLTWSDEKETWEDRK